MSLGTLYSGDFLCPFSHRVLIAARETGASIDTVYGRDIPKSVREANKSGSWPVFVTADGGELLDDSAKIVDYLIARSGERGEAYRSDPATMAKLDPIVMNISKVIRAGKPAIQKEAREKLDRGLADAAAILAASGGPYLGGDRFSQADGHVTPFLYRLPFLVEVRDHVPRIFLENAELNAWVETGMKAVSSTPLAKAVGKKVA